MQRPNWSLIFGWSIGIVVGVFAGIGLASLRQPRQGTLQTRAGTDATAELARVNDLLKAGEVQDAYDALLAAMRVAPDDKKVFDASLEFIRKAVKDNNDDGLALAQDAYQRAAGLIPFLPLAQLKEARAAHTKAGDELFAGQRVTMPYDPLADAESLLSAAGQSKLPPLVRAHLLHDAEAELSNQTRRVTLTRFRSIEEEENFWKKWEVTKAHYDEAQKDVLAALYRKDCEPRLWAWAKKVDDFIKVKGPGVSLKIILAVNAEIDVLIVEGQRINRDLMPFLEGGVDAAVRDNRLVSPDECLTRLARLREWNYNCLALDCVETIEKKSGGSTLEKLRSLATIDETRLAPYVGQRLSDVWKKQFEECSQADKVEATKLRILRENQK